MFGLVVVAPGSDFALPHFGHSTTDRRILPGASGPYFATNAASTIASGNISCETILCSFGLPEHPAWRKRAKGGQDYDRDGSNSLLARVSHSLDPRRKSVANGHSAIRSKPVLAFGAINALSTRRQEVRAILIRKEHQTTARGSLAFVGWSDTNSF
jgi:hypothetical protein